MADALFPVSARGIGVRFGATPALHDVDIDVEAGGKLVILGANGAGKSMLLRVLHGLIAPTEGRITWGGDARRPREQAMVFQRPVLLRRTALANVEYALAIQGVDRAAATRRAHAALEHVGLASLAHRAARVLSGGEQQRLALARAWALEPRLLFLDEPTASLDPGAAAEVERIVADIHAAGTAIVLATHNLGFARRLGGRVALLHQGRIAEHRDVDEFFTAPASMEARQFLNGELPWPAPVS